MSGRHVELDGGNVLVYGHWGRPVVAFPSEQGHCGQFEERGMIEALTDLLGAGRVKVYCVDSYDSASWHDDSLPLEERARRHDVYERWLLDDVVPFVRDDCDGATEMILTGPSFGAYHAANLALRRADLFPVAICQSGVYDVSGLGWGERGDAVYFHNPMDYVTHLHGDHLDWLRGRANLVLTVGRGSWEDTTGAFDSSHRFAALLGEKQHPARARRLGAGVAARLAVLARAARAPPPTLRLMARHLIGLLLGTEEDWPSAYEELVRRIGPVEWRGETHDFATERIVNEPFDLRYRPRYELVIDRLAWWYDVPREWLKKIALMDDVYLLNNPFTFQAMEKHSAYCAMMRLGLKVPETWLIPHKLPPDNPRFRPTAERYNAAFDLETIGAQVGYPLFMKPFDGGQWVGVSRVRDATELHRRYDESGERLMHLQAAVEDFDVFARSLTIGPETMVMHFEPDRPMFDRYQVDHDFLTPELGWEVVTISRLVNAFFRWEFNSCETIVKDGRASPIDYANASPDVALTSLHYYFPWAMAALARWSLFCLAAGRQVRIEQDVRPYFEIGDRDDLTYEEKLRAYRGLVDSYFQLDEYEAFCAEALPHVDETLLELVESTWFDALLVETVQTTFPRHEHERFVAHYRGLLAAWAADRPPA